MFELHEVDWPYPGLRPFEAWETEIFRGRRAHVDRLLEILARERFLAVIGPSGSGKSSLVRAGLLPELPQGRLGTGTRWRVATLRPGNEPVRRLARALLQREALGEMLLDDARIPATPDAQTLEVALLEAELRRRGERGLVDVTAQAQARQAEADAQQQLRRPACNLLVLVDQFEELFTHLDAAGLDAAARQALAEEADAFVSLLLTARAAADAQIVVVLTMRTDFLGASVRFADLPDAINRAQYLTPRLKSDEIRAAIVEPARLFGGDIDDVLVQELINAVGIDPDQLPILQHALGRMWSFASRRAGPGRPVRIEQQDFERAGGVRDALSNHADSVLAQLVGLDAVPASLLPLQVRARELFCAITEQRSAESGGQTVRRPQVLARVAERAGRPVADYVPVLQAFADPAVNFLTYQGALGPDTVIDISHEALIRQWSRLRAWVADEGRRGGEYRRLRRQAGEYNCNDVGASLLTGSALARALEWLDAGGAQSDDGWRPSAAWAQRYARDPATRGAGAEFDQVCRFIRRSAEAEAAAEEQRHQDEKAEIERAAETALRAEQERLREAKAEALAKEQRRQVEKAEQERQAAQALAATEELRRQAAEAFAAEQKRRVHEANEAAARRTRQNRSLWFVCAVAVALAGYGVYQSNRADERRRVLEGHALWLPLTIESNTLSTKDADALLRVARSDDEHLIDFSTRLRDEEEYAERFLRAPAAVLAAMVGPSPQARDQALALFRAAPAAAAAADGRKDARKDGSSARALARAVLQLALSPGSADDNALAQQFANAARQYRNDDPEAWRLICRGLAAVLPDLASSRRLAMFRALKLVAADASIGPRQMMTLTVAMGVLRMSPPESEMAALFDRLLQVSIDAARASDAQSAQRAASGQAVDEAADELHFERSRRDLLRDMVALVAKRMLQEDAAQRWERVWKEIDARLRTDGGDSAAAAAASASGGGSGSSNDGDASKRDLERADMLQLLPILAARLADDKAWDAYDQLLQRLLATGQTPTGRASAGAGAASTSAWQDSAAVQPLGLALERLAAKRPAPRRLADAIHLLDVAAGHDRPPAIRKLMLRLLNTQVGRLSPEQARSFAPRLAAVRWLPGDSGGRSPSRDEGAALWEKLLPSLAGTPALALVPSWARGADAAAAAAPEPPGTTNAKPPPPAPVDARLDLPRLLSRINATKESDELQPLGHALEVLLAKAAPEQAGELSDTLLAALLDSGDIDQQRALAQGLNAALSRLPPARLADARRKLLAVINADRSLSLRSVVWSSYARLADASPAAERVEIGSEMAAMITSGRAATTAIGPKLNALAGQLAPEDRPRLAERLTDTLERLAEADSVRPDGGSALSVLALFRRPYSTVSERVRALEPVAARLISGSAPAAREAQRGRIIQSIQASQSMAGGAALGRLLRVAAGTVVAEQQSALVQIMAALPRSGRAQDIDTLVAAANALLATQAASAEVAAQLFELMKYPSRLRESAKTLRTVFKDAPKPDDGLWALVDWARTRWPRLPLNQRLTASG